LYSNCRHITAAQKNLESLSELLSLSINLSPEQAAAAVAQTCSTRTIFKDVYLIYQSKHRPGVIFHPMQSSEICRSKGGCNLPALLLLDDSVYCSCEYVGTYVHDNIVEDAFIVYTSTSALECKIQTVYCYAGINTWGRIQSDLGNYGILNWNNPVGFVHELLNNYTSQFTSSEMPFFTFHQTILNM